MGFIYQKLPENRQLSRLRTGFPAKAWVAVRRAAVKVVGLYVGRRRWVTRHVTRKVMWVPLWGRMRRAVGPCRPVPVSYDLASYVKNFDDGAWKEEDEFWRGGSFAYRFGHSTRLVG